MAGEDGYYSWQEDAFRADILLEGGVEPEAMELGDSIVTLPDGTRYSAMLVTREEISRIMDRHAVSGESLAGAYFSTPDLVVVRRPGVSAMIEVIRDIVAAGDAPALLPRIRDDGVLEPPPM